MLSNAPGHTSGKWKNQAGGNEDEDSGGNDKNCNICLKQRLSDLFGLLSPFQKK